MLDVLPARVRQLRHRGVAAPGARLLDGGSVELDEYRGDLLPQPRRGAR